MRFRVCLLLAATALLATACSGADTSAPAFTGGPEPESEIPAEAEAETAADAPADAPAAEETEPAEQADPLDPRERGVLRNYLGYEFPPAPEVPTGPIDPLAVDTLELIWLGLESGGFTGGTVASLADFGDARLA